MDHILTLDSETRQYWRVRLSNAAITALTVLALPVLVVQGRRVRRTAPRLPEAVGTSGTAGDGPVRCRILVVGDSVAAGQGVDRGEHTIAGRLASLLSDGGEAVHWAILARGGLDAAGVRRRLESAEDDLAAAAVVVLSVGVNDLKALHSVGRWRAELTSVLDHLRAAAPKAQVVMLGLPPLEMFPALPRPLRDVLGARGRMLDAVARELATSSGAGYVTLDPSALEGANAFADDGFHPSAATHAAMAEAVVRLLDDERKKETDVVR